METLFSCRNCVHNCGQTLNVGRGDGFCLQHGSVIQDPDRTTCKYLHRKDLPLFVVDEGVREHAAEYAFAPGLVRLESHQLIRSIAYSERHYWETDEYDGLTQALAQYHRVKSGRWMFIQAFTAGTDGRRSVAQGSLIRRYLHKCQTWTSSYRLILGLLKEIDNTPLFAEQDLLIPSGESREEIEVQAIWDTVFVRLSAIQEYGWHAGMEKLTWITDQLNGGLSDLHWSKLQPELQQLRTNWIKEVILHAKDNNEFFPPPDTNLDLDQDF